MDRASEDSAIGNQAKPVRITSTKLLENLYRRCVRNAECHDRKRNYVSFFILASLNNEATSGPRFDAKECERHQAFLIGESHEDAGKKEYQIREESHIFHYI